jgi:hypothetical protein
MLVLFDTVVFARCRTRLVKRIDKSITRRAIPTGRIQT